MYDDSCVSTCLQQEGSPYSVVCTPVAKRLWEGSSRDGGGGLGGGGSRKAARYSAAASAAAQDGRGGGGMVGGVMTQGAGNGVNGNHNKDCFRRRYRFSPERVVFFVRQ